MDEEDRDYSLILSEKPDAARRIAEALALGGVETLKVDGVPVFKFKNGDGNFLVCSASGHLYTMSDLMKDRGVYPVFDLEWFPTSEVNEDARFLRNRISAIRSLAKGSKEFINACDYDVEGETIGYNILRYACGDKEQIARRAKFSTMTNEELVSAFRDAKRPSGDGLARAGRTRHFLDFVWGINLSRALSKALTVAYSAYRPLTIGRVQGPTLAFVVEREIEIRTFVPVPFWVVSGVFEKDGERFEAMCAIPRFEIRSKAEEVVKSCESKLARVSEVSKSVFKQPPPFPFNIGDLQKEAYRVFGFTPSRTLQVAERLYLDALISYPRTSSQKLPVTIKYREIVSKLGRSKEYSPLTPELLAGRMQPREGAKVDSAHPAIYPTGELPRRALDSQETKIFDLVIRRFFVCFAEDAIRERVSARIVVGPNEFRLTGRRTLKPGWMRYYAKYTGIEDKPAPALEEGDELVVIKINSEQKFEQHPSRYNQSSLLEKMERESIGTKATRAEIISTLMNRGYMGGDGGLAATDLGLSVIEIMKKYSPDIVSTSLTREMEAALERVESGELREHELKERAIDLLLEQIMLVKSNEENIGREIGTSVVQTTLAQSIVGKCPVCHTGNLRVIRSAKTKKRFVGCTNYPSGCRASAPLPQRGTIKPAKNPCNLCGWPIVYVRSGRYPWRLCVNINCDSKSEWRRKNNDGVQAVQKRS